MRGTRAIIQTRYVAGASASSPSIRVTANVSSALTLNRLNLISRWARHQGLNNYGNEAMHNNLRKTLDASYIRLRSMENMRRRRSPATTRYASA